MSAEPAGKVFVLLFRGGVADGVYRLALGRVPPSVEVLVEKSGERETCSYAGDEPQTRDAYRYDAAAKQTVRERVVEAHYQIFRPAGEGLG